MYRQYAQNSDEECVFKFFETLANVWRFDHEIFPCSIGVAEISSAPSFYLVFVVRLGSQRGSGRGA